MLDEIRQPLAEWELGLLPPENVPALAVAALERGCDYSEIALQAGLNEPTKEEVEPQLERLLQHAKCPRLSRGQAIKTLADPCVARIAQGALEPAQGAHKLWRLANTGDFGDPVWSQLSAFIGFASEWDDRPDARELLETQIVEAAQALSARGGIQLESQ